MSDARSAGNGADHRDADTWPWRCLGCGGTIYHDAEFCRECSSLGPHRGASRRRDATGGFVDWIRRESASGLSIKVSVVAGVELALTAVWLRVLLDPSALAAIGSIVS